jgi:hypothetical protein
MVEAKVDAEWRATLSLLRFTLKPHARSAEKRDWPGKQAMK